MVYVAGRLRHHQRCLHRFCHQLCGPDFPNRSTKCQPHLIFNLPRLKCLIHPVNIFHMMVSLLLHVSTPETLQRRIVTWEILESCLWLNKLLSFIPLFTRRPLIVPFCLVFRPSVTIQTLFPVSSCHCEEEFVPSRVACFSLSELTLTCGCERPRSTSGGGPVMLRLPWEWLMGGLGRFNVAAASGGGGDVVLDCAQAYMWGNQ